MIGESIAMQEILNTEMMILGLKQFFVKQEVMFLYNLCPEQLIPDIWSKTEWPDQVPHGFIPVHN